MFRQHKSITFQFTFRLVLYASDSAQALTDWRVCNLPATWVERVAFLRAREKCGISSLSGIEPLIYMPREVLRSSKEILAPKFLAELSLFVAGNQAKMPCGRYRRVWSRRVKRFVFYCYANDCKTTPKSLKETCLSSSEILLFLCV
jgi:hypothetical protein